MAGRRRSANKAITVQYPEEQHVPSPNYRGVHRLNKDEQGRVKCVACMLCATACPAHCIDIVGATAPETWPDREKYCESFVIDELRCIYCGMCEEACPVEAIELTGLYDLTGLSREQMIFDKTKLLSVFDLTKDAEPMRYGAPPAPAARRRRPQLLPPTTNFPDRDPDLDRSPRTRADRGPLAQRDLILAVVVVVLGAAGTYLLLPHRHGAAKPRTVHAVGGGARRRWPCCCSRSSGRRPGPWLSGLFFYAFSLAAVAAARAHGHARGTRSTAPSGSPRSCSRPRACSCWPGRQFLAAGTVIVYAGAIIVTFLFVIMLAQMEGRALYDRAARMPFRATFTCFLLFLGRALRRCSRSSPHAAGGSDPGGESSADAAAARATDASSTRLGGRGRRRSPRSCARSVRPTARLDTTTATAQAARRRAGRDALHRPPGHRRARRRPPVRRPDRRPGDRHARSRRSGRATTRTSATVTASTATPTTANV